MLKKALRVLGAVLVLLIVCIGVFVAYVQLTYKRDFSSTPRPDLKSSTDPKIIEQGEYLTNAIAHCSACHSPASAVEARVLPADIKNVSGGYELKAGPFGTYRPANLTSDPETGIGKLTDPDLARIIRHGVAPDGRLDAFMSFVVGPMADEDLVAIMSYLRSLPPIKNATKPSEWGFIAKALSSKFNPNMRKAPKYVPAGGASAARGEYLANGPALCGGCHSPYDFMKGMELAGPAFSGEFEPEPDPTDGAYEIVSPNITIDPTGVLANYTEDTFVQRFKKGGRAIKGSKMPWENFARMTDDDLRSIFRFLQTVPPAKRVTGPSRRNKGWKP